MRAPLASWVAERLQVEDGVEITDLRLPGAGASNETILFTVHWSGGDGERHADLVLRAQAPTNQLFLNPDVFFQWDVMSALGECSEVSVPPLRWREADRAVLGTPFFVMDQVPGEVPNGYRAPLFERLGPEQVRRLYTNALNALAGVHGVDWRRLSLRSADRPAGLQGYLTILDDWYEWARAGRRFDHVERAMTFLWDEMPGSTPVSLIWGDSRPGNMIVDPVDQHIAAVLDWEIADVATPEVDLAWWLMFETLFADRSGTEVPSGVPTRDETLTIYEAAVGRPLRDLAYHDVLAWTRFVLTCIRHVDVEQGSPSEAMFKELNEYAIDQLRRAQQEAVR